MILNDDTVVNPIANENYQIEFISYGIYVLSLRGQIANKIDDTVIL